jgi:hypothetical protein
LSGPGRFILPTTTKSISFGEVKDARTQGQQLLLQAVAMILGLFPSESAADQAGRAKLLGPILRQNEAIRVYLRSRRNVEDVDPDTGLPVPVPGAADGPPGPAPAP